MGSCKPVVFCCQTLVQLNNQGYKIHFPVANASPREPDRRQAFKNGGRRVLPNPLPLQCLGVPTSPGQNTKLPQPRWERDKELLNCFKTWTSKANRTKE